MNSTNRNLIIAHWKSEAEAAAREKDAKYILDTFRVRTASQGWITLVIEWNPQVSTAIVRTPSGPSGTGIRCPSYLTALQRIREVHMEAVFVRRESH